MGLFTILKLFIGFMVLLQQISESECGKNGSTKTIQYNQLHRIYVFFLKCYLS